MHGFFKAESGGKGIYVEPEIPVLGAGDGGGGHTKRTGLLVVPFRG